MELKELENTSFVTFQVRFYSNFLYIPTDIDKMKSFYDELKYLIAKNNLKKLNKFIDTNMRNDERYMKSEDLIVACKTIFTKYEIKNELI